MTQSENLLRVQAGRFAGSYWKELWRHRELAWFMARRDLLIRYKDTALGVAWALLRPLLTMLVLVVVFHRLAGFSGQGAPYPVLVFAALLPWQLFSSALSEVGNSLLQNSHIVTRVYFPRLVLPLSAMAVAIADFAVTLALLALLMVFYGQLVGWPLLALPVFVALAALTALAAGIWVSALQVRYRDVRFIVPFVVQFGLYLSPVGFSTSVVPEDYRLLYSLNPMVGAIDGFRWCLLGQPFYWPAAALSVIVTAVLLVTGVRYFRSVERSVADLM
ncbi:MAG: phosphate ABC transporter permease [Betaproteobacteria bacterium RIFCSPLOWO2_02_FULL_63_19]|nr:MAG: phosphate ABC transporter permease [Betaproteobacteria bacterium RIFCSPLOWO2_02_FULL_63_19]